MIGLRYQGQYLTLFENTSINVSAKNPMFGGDSIPGTRVYDFRLPLDAVNKRLIGHVQRLDDETPWPTLDNVGLHFGKGLHLWRIGKLKVRKATKDDCTVSFHTDAGDVATAIKDKKLADYDLGTAAVNFQPELTYPDVNYTFFPVKNADFYGDANPDYLGYVNYYDQGAFGTNTSANNHTLVPYPFLLYILNRLFQQLGYYGITGSWTQQTDIRSLVIYNTQSLDRITGVLNRYASSFKYADHMPNISVGQFLVALQNLFCIGFFINPITRMVQIEPLSTILKDGGYKNITYMAGQAYEKGNRYENGFSLAMGTDSRDDMYNQRSTAPFSFAIDAGGNEFHTAAGTLFETKHQDTINTNRTWTIPEAAQTGNSAPFEVEGDYGLRLLFYRGLQADSTGNAYPRGSSEGTEIALRYDTGKGLYVQSWQAWLDFLSRTVAVETQMQFPIKDFMELDWQKKIMRLYQRYFLGEYAFSVNMKEGIQPAKVTLFRTNL